MASIAERRAYQAQTRARLIEEGVVLQTSVRRCRECGCTDELACPGGCWWIELDLCSQCANELALTHEARL